jgi:hypothetical protein
MGFASAGAGEPRGKIMTVTEYDEILFDKIGGWLVLPAFIHPLLAIPVNLKASYDLFNLYSEKLPLSYQIFFFITATLGVAFAIAWFISGYLAGSLSPSFPTFYIWLNVAGVVLSILVGAVVYYYFGVALAEQDIADIIKQIIPACIWIPYMLRSKRVKATFYGIPMPQKLAFKNISSPLEQVSSAREEERRKQTISEDGMNLNMVQRIGMVLYWAGTGLGAILLVIGAFALVNAADRFVALATLTVAVISWLVGRALKYIFVGK